MSKQEWWRGAVIYQIYPRSFMDSNGDGIGDLPGIISKVDYIASLNIDAVWLSPVFTSPMKDFGYDVSDYRGIDPVFGTLDDFKELVQKLHAYDIKVIIDQVWAHTSNQHEWFKTSRQDKENDKADWYIWVDPKDDGSLPNNWLSLFGGPAWTWDEGRQQYYMHHFLSEQPNLNYWNPDVREAIKDITRFWMNLGVDGFRLDVINSFINHPDLLDNPPRGDRPIPSDIAADNPMAGQYRCNGYSYVSDETYEWLEELRTCTDAYDSVCLMGEVGGEHSSQRACDFTKTGKRLHTAYSFSYLRQPIGKSIIENTIQKIENQIDDGWMTNTFSNHDYIRTASKTKDGETGDTDFILFAMALGLSLRGSFCLYQGEELGLEEAEVAFEDMQDPYGIEFYPEFKGRDGCRTPMPWNKDSKLAGFSAAEKSWLPIYSPHLKKAMDQQDDNPNSVLNHFRRFLKWRKTQDVLKIGNIDLIETPEPLIAFSRSLETQTMLCIFNDSNDETKFNLPDGEWKLSEDISRNIAVHDEKVKLKAYGFGFFDKLKS
ncbi:MAG: alpha-amylase family glycosyl hydrolase [Pseudomonadota bacterium]